jgi:hypothetical protein
MTSGVSPGSGGVVLKAKRRSAHKAFFEDFSYGTCIRAFKICASDRSAPGILEVQHSLSPNVLIRLHATGKWISGRA